MIILLNKTMLREKLKAERWTPTLLSKRLNMSVVTLRYKLRGDGEFKASEITELKDILNLTDSEVVSIFLSRELDKTSDDEDDTSPESEETGCST